MIDALISIADRLIQLKTYGDSRLKELHASLLQPLFNELLLIHNDYMQLFDKTEKMLPSLDEAVQGCSRSVHNTSCISKTRQPRSDINRTRRATTFFANIEGHLVCRRQTGENRSG